MPARAKALGPLVAAALVAALGAGGGSGCGAEVTVAPQQDASTVGRVVIHGRIFDLETCPEGCLVVVGAVVSLDDDPAVLSEPTGPDGAFALGRVPRQSSQRLRAETTTGIVGSYVTTLNVNAVAVGEEDVFGVELYMLSAGDADLLGAIASESSRDLRVEGGYVGEVIRRDPEPEAVAGAEVELFPADFPMRYVNVIPRYVPGEDVLQPSTATGTSGYGLFVVAPFGDPQQMGVLVTANGLGFEPLLLPMAPGTLAFGLHVGTPGAVDGGTPDGALLDGSTVH
ncbi:MAG: hypothetical protein HY906_06540 [Deltaproteobacteria bacterium]|nr:hypothetical protein [Deltaproteobacteria bacterium]